MNRALILTAAGSSTRMGGPVKKEYLIIAENEAGRISVLSSALHAFLSTKLFSDIIITVPSNGETEARRVIAEDRRIAPLLEADGITLFFAEGGRTRQESVRAGIELLAVRWKNGDRAGDDIVLIHDGARPWISETTIKRVIETTILHGAAVPGIPSVDTQKEIDEAGRIIRHLDRSRVMSVQTPQGFRFDEIRDAHAKAADDGHEYTDDTEIWGRYAGDVYVCPGDRENRKITYQGDL
jgi:4-diphosphocytidyl-2-methyl-D-erithritol synthase